MLDSYSDNTCLFYSKNIYDVTIGENLFTACGKAFALALIVSGIVMITLAFVCQYPLFIPSYVAFGAGGGLLFISYCVNCCGSFVQCLKEESEKDNNDENRKKAKLLAKYQARYGAEI